MSRKNRKRKGKSNEKVLKSVLGEDNIVPTKIHSKSKHVSKSSVKQKITDTLPTEKQVKELLSAIKNFCSDCKTLTVDLDNELITYKKDKVYHIINFEGKEFHQYVYIKEKIHFDEHIVNKFKEQQQHD